VEAKGLRLKFVDSHIHLADEEYEGRVEEILREAFEAGVFTLIAVSEDLESGRRSLKLAEKYPWRILPALGVHPWPAGEIKPTDVEEVSRMIVDEASRLAAVGEVGLDWAYTRGESEVWERQKEIFRVMLKAAEKTGLPVVVHSRQSAAEALEEVKTYRLRRVVFHWFSGPIEVLRQVLDYGCFITVGPAIYYSKHIQQIVSLTPIDALMAETDGPVRYRGPFKGLETRPSLIPRVIEKISEVKALKFEDVAWQILENCRKVFPLVAEAERKIFPEET